MAGKWKGCRALNWGERCQLPLIALALPLVHAAIGLFGVQRTQAWLERRSLRSAARTASVGDLDSARRLAHLVSVAGRHGPISATCLRQSLVLYWLLRRRGLQPNLRLGVRKQADAFDAHAWVELEGQPLSPAPIQHQPFPIPNRSP